MSTNERGRNTRAPWQPTHHQGDRYYHAHRAPATPRAAAASTSARRCPSNHHIATVGRLALYSVRYSGAEGRASLWVMGKRILESWNCMVLARLHADAGTVAVLIIYGARVLGVSMFVCECARASVHVCV